jgi:hypothetical protein
MVDFPDASIKCPYTGFKKPCRELALSCPKFVHIAGANPNTGEPVDRYGCADGFLPMLLIENSQQQRQTGAAVESFRNEMVRLNDVSRLFEVGAPSHAGPSHTKEIADARDDQQG